MNSFFTSQTNNVTIITCTMNNILPMMASPTCTTTSTLISSYGEIHISTATNILPVETSPTSTKM